MNKRSRVPSISKTAQRYIDEQPSYKRSFESDKHALSREYKQKYGGRGKYRRVLTHYNVDVTDRKGKYLESPMAWGWKDLRDVRSAVYSRHKRTGYRIKIFNVTRGKWIKK